MSVCLSETGSVLFLTPTPPHLDPNQECCTILARTHIARVNFVAVRKGSVGKKIVKIYTKSIKNIIYYLESVTFILPLRSLKGQ